MTLTQAERGTDDTLKRAVELLLHNLRYPDARLQVAGSGWSVQLGKDEQAAIVGSLTALQCGVPDGWQLVPKEPTREQYIAYREAFERCPEGEGYFNAFDAGYQAALAAATPFIADKRESS